MPPDPLSPPVILLATDRPAGAALLSGALHRAGVRAELAVAATRAELTALLERPALAAVVAALDPLPVDGGSSGLPPLAALELLRRHRPELPLLLVERGAGGGLEGPAYLVSPLLGDGAGDAQDLGAAVNAVIQARCARSDRAPSAEPEPAAPPASPPVQEPLQVRAQILSALIHDTADQRDLPGLFQDLLRRLVDDFGADFACMAEVEGGPGVGKHIKTERLPNIELTQRRTKNDNVEIVINAMYTRDPQILADLGVSASEPGSRFPMDPDVLGRCLGGRTIYQADAQSGTGVACRRFAEARLRAMVAVPLRVRDRALGVLQVARRAPLSFDGEERKFLQQLADALVLAVHQHLMQRNLQDAHDELHAAQQAMMQQERLKAVGQMASGIAHDINNALAPITMYSELMLAVEPNLSPDSRRLLQLILSASLDISHTTQRLSDFYRQRGPMREPVPLDVNQLITQVVELTRPRWRDMPLRRGVVIGIETDLALRLPPVLGSASELREALTNLVFNAVDAMPYGGRLMLRTEAQGQIAVITVADTGIGMSAATRARCFEPFFTTKGDEGSGLGLPMVYGIIKAHGGDIFVTSEPGQGARFVLSLPGQPVQPDARPAQEPAPAVWTDATRDPGGGLRVLCVDDEPLVLEVLSHTLQLDGHEVLSADSARAALLAFAAAKARGAPVDLVITDLSMPHMDGRELALQLQQEAPALKVVLISGWGEGRGFDPGAADADGPPGPVIETVLTKPLSFDELRQVVRRYQRRAPGV